MAGVGQAFQGLLVAGAGVVVESRVQLRVALVVPAVAVVGLAAQGLGILCQRFVQTAVAAQGQRQVETRHRLVGHPCHCALQHRHGGLEQAQPPQNFVMVDHSRWHIRVARRQRCQQRRGVLEPAVAGERQRPFQYLLRRVLSGIGHGKQRYRHWRRRNLRRPRPRRLSRPAAPPLSWSKLFCGLSLSSPPERALPVTLARSTA